MAQKFNKNLQFDGIAEGFFTTSIDNNAINTTNDMTTNENTETKKSSNNTKKTTTKKQPTKKQATKKDASTNNPEQNKSKGGRPPKSGLKNVQFSLTMNPILYEKLRVVADERCRGNFSQLIDEAIHFYCRENDINLKDITIDEAIIDNYLTKQKLKQSKQKSNK